MSHDPPTDLDQRERDLMRELRLEQVPQGLPEYHNPSRSLTVAEGAYRRRQLATATGTVDGYVPGAGAQHAAELDAELVAAARERRRHLRAVSA